MSIAIGTGSPSEFHEFRKEVGGKKILFKMPATLLPATKEETAEVRREKCFFSIWKRENAFLKDGAVVEVTGANTVNGAASYTVKYSLPEGSQTKVVGEEPHVCASIYKRLKTEMGEAQVSFKNSAGEVVGATLKPVILMAAPDPAELQIFKKEILAKKLAFDFSSVQRELQPEQRENYEFFIWKAARDTITAGMTFKVVEQPGGSLSWYDADDQRHNAVRCAVWKAKPLSAKSTVEVTRTVVEDGIEKLEFYTPDNLAEFKKAKQQKNLQFVLVNMGAAAGEETDLIEYSVWQDAKNRNFPDGAVFCVHQDPNGTLSYYNRKPYTEVFGTHPDAVVENSIANESEWDKIFIQHALTKAGPRDSDLEFVRRTPDGRAYLYKPVLTIAREVNSLVGNGKVRQGLDRFDAYSIWKHAGQNLKNPPTRVELLKKDGENCHYYTTPVAQPAWQWAQGRGITIRTAGDYEFRGDPNYQKGAYAEMAHMAIMEHLQGDQQGTVVVFQGLDHVGNYLYTVSRQKVAPLQARATPDFYNEAHARNIQFTIKPNDYYSSYNNAFTDDEDTHEMHQRAFSSIWEQIKGDRSIEDGTQIEVTRCRNGQINYKLTPQDADRVAPAKVVQVAPPAYSVAVKELELHAGVVRQRPLEKVAKGPLPEVYATHQVVLKEIQIITYESTLRQILVAIYHFFLGLYSQVFKVQEHVMAESLFAGNAKKGSMVNHTRMLSHLGIMESLFARSELTEISQTLREAQECGALMHRAVEREDEASLADFEAEGFSLKERALYNLRQVPEKLNPWAQAAPKVKFCEFVKQEVQRKIAVALSSGKTFLLPVGIGENEQYSPHFLLFSRDENGHTIVKDIRLSPPHLQSKYSSVVTHDLGTMPVGEFVGHLIALQPRSSQMQQEPTVAAKRIDRSLETFIAGQIAEHNKTKGDACFRVSESQQESTVDPWALFHNALSEANFSLPTAAKQEKFQAIFGSKTAFMRQYVNHLVTFLDEHEGAFSTQEKIKVLEAIKHYGIRLKALIAEELGNQGVLVASEITDSLLAKVVFRLEEENRTLEMESRDVTNLEHEVRLFSLNLQKPIDATMDAQPLAAMQLNKPKPFSLPAKTMRALAHLPARFAIQATKEQRATVLQDVRTHIKTVEELLATGKVKQAKMVAFALLKTLPAPAKENGDKTFWDQLGSKEEVKAWSDALYAVSERFFEAALRSKQHPLSPEEAFYFNTVTKLNMMHLYDRYTSFFPVLFDASIAGLNAHHGVFTDLFQIKEAYISLYDTPLYKGNKGPELENQREALIDRVDQFLAYVEPGKSFATFIKALKDDLRGRLYNGDDRELKARAEKVLTQVIQGRFGNIVNAFVGAKISQVDERAHLTSACDSLIAQLQQEKGAPLTEDERRDIARRFNLIAPSFGVFHAVGTRLNANRQEIAQNIRERFIAPLLAHVPPPLAEKPSDRGAQVQALNNHLETGLNAVLQAHQVLVVADLTQITEALPQDARALFTAQVNRMGAQLHGMQRVYALARNFELQKKEQIHKTETERLEKQWKEEDENEVRAIEARDKAIKEWTERDEAIAKNIAQLEAYKVHMRDHYSQPVSQRRGNPPAYPFDNDLFSERLTRFYTKPERIAVLNGQYAARAKSLQAEMTQFDTAYAAWRDYETEKAWRQRQGARLGAAAPADAPKEVVEPQWTNRDFPNYGQQKKYGLWGDNPLQQLEAEKQREIGEIEREVRPTDDSCNRVLNRPDPDSRPEKIIARNRGELAIERQLELQKAIEAALQNDEFLQSIPEFTVAQMGRRRFWLDDASRHPAQMQAFFGQVAREIGMSRELYAETLYAMQGGLKASLDATTKKEPAKYILMLDDNTHIALASRPELAQLRKDCGAMIARIEADRRPDLTTFDAREHFLTGYSNKGDGLQLNRRKTFLDKISFLPSDIKTEDDVFVYRINLCARGYAFTEGEAGDFLASALVAPLRKRDAMTATLEAPVQHVEFHRTELFSGEVLDFFSSNPTDESLRSDFAKQSRIYLQSAVQKVTLDRVRYEKRAFVLSTTPDTASGTYCTKPSDDTPTVAKTALRSDFHGQITTPLVDDHLVDDGERDQAMKSFALNMDAKPVDGNPYDPKVEALQKAASRKEKLAKEGERALGLNAMREFLLRCVAVKDGQPAASPTDHPFTWRSVEFALEYIYQFPDELIQDATGEQVQHRLLSTLLQPELIEKALLNNPQFFIDFATHLERTCVLYDQKKHSDKKEGHPEGGSRFDSGKLFLRHVGEKIRQVAVFLKDRRQLSEDQCAQLTAGLPTHAAYEANLVECTWSNGGMYQKLFAVYLLEHYRTCSRVFTRDDYAHLLKAHAVILQNPSEMGHSGHLTEAEHAFYMTHLPQLEESLEDLENDANQQFLSSLIGGKGVRHGGPKWQRVAEYVYKLTEVDGKSYTIDLSTGEGLNIATSMDKRGGLPREVLDHPDYKFLFGDKNLLVQPKDCGDGLAEYHWQEAGTGIRYLIRYQKKNETHPVANCQIFQKHGPRSKEVLYRFTRLELDASFLSLSFNQNNAKIEELIARRGAWVRLNKAGQPQTDHVYLPQDGNNIEKDPIRLHIRSNKITGATVGEGNQLKWVVSALASSDASLLPFKGLDNMLLLSSDRRHVDEIRFFNPQAKASIGSESYFLTLRRNPKNREQWDVANREGWVWQLKKTAHLEKQFGKNYRENSLHLINPKTGEEESWFFPYVATGTYQKGSDVHYMKRMIDFVDLLEEMFGQATQTAGNSAKIKEMMDKMLKEAFESGGGFDAGREDTRPGKMSMGLLCVYDLYQNFQEKPFEFLRAVVGSASEAFNSKKVEVVKKFAEKSGGSEQEKELVKEQIDELFGRARGMMDGFFKDILSPRVLKIGKSGTVGSHASFLYQAQTASLRGDWGVASDFLQRMTQFGDTKTVEELEQLEYLISKVLVKDSLGQLVQGRLARPASIEQTAFQLKLLTCLKIIAKRLEAQFQRPVSNIITKMTTQLTSSKMNLGGGSLANAPGALVECVYMASLLNDYNTQLPVKGAQLEALGLLLTREERVALRGYVPVDLLTLVDPNDPHSAFPLLPQREQEQIKQALALLGIGNMAPAAPASQEFAIPTREEVNRLMRTVAENINPNQKVDIAALHAKEGSYLKWETVVANFYSYIDWIYNHKNLKASELSFLLAEIPFLTKNREDVDTARRMILTFYHHLHLSGHFEAEHHGATQSVDFERAFKDVQALAARFPDLATQEKNIKAYLKQMSENPSTFRVMKFGAYRLWGSMRKWLTQQEDKVKVGAKELRYRGHWALFQNACGAVLFDHVLDRLDPDFTKISIFGFKKDGAVPAAAGAGMGAAFATTGMASAGSAGGGVGLAGASGADVALRRASDGILSRLRSLADRIVTELLPGGGFMANMARGRMRDAIDRDLSRPAQQLLAAPQFASAYPQFINALAGVVDSFRQHSAEAGKLATFLRSGAAVSADPEIAPFIPMLTELKSNLEQDHAAYQRELAAPKAAVSDLPRMSVVDEKEPVRASVSAARSVMPPARSKNHLKEEVIDGPMGVLNRLKGAVKLVVSIGVGLNKTLTEREKAQHTENLSRKMVNQLRGAILDLLDNEDFDRGYREFAEAFACFAEWISFSAAEGKDQSALARVIRASNDPQFSVSNYSPDVAMGTLMQQLKSFKDNLSKAFQEYRGKVQQAAALQPAHEITIDRRLGNPEKWDDSFTDISGTAQWRQKWATEKEIIRKQLREHLKPNAVLGEMEDHVYKKIFDGIEVSANELQTKCSRSLQLKDVKAVKTKIDARLQVLEGEIGQVKKSIDALVKDNAEALGLIHLLGAAEEVNRLEGDNLLGSRIFKIVLHKYRDGKIGSKELDVALTQYMLACTERDQLIKAKEVHRRMWDHLDDLCTGLRKDLTPHEKQQIIQRKADGDILWLLMSHELHQFMTEGSDRLRYATVKADGTWVLSQPIFSRKYLFSDYEKKQIARAKAKESIEKIINFQRRPVVVTDNVSSLATLLKGVKAKKAKLVPLVPGSVEEAQAHLGHLEEGQCLLITPQMREQLRVSADQVAAVSGGCDYETFFAATHRKMRFDKVRMGVGKSTNIFPRATEILLEQGCEPVVVTTEELVMQLRDFMDERAFTFKFDISYGLTPEESHKDEVVIPHLRRLKDSLYALQTQGRYVLTTPARLAFIRNKEKELNKHLGGMDPKSEVGLRTFEKLQLMKEISAYFHRDRTVYLEDEDVCRLVAKEYNYAVGERGTVDDVFYTVYERFIFKLFENDALRNAVMTNNLRGVNNVDAALRPVLATLYNDTRFWEDAGWRGWEHVDQEQFIAYITGKTNHLPANVQSDGRAPSEADLVGKVDAFCDDGRFWTEKAGFKADLRLPSKQDFRDRAAGKKVKSFDAYDADVRLQFDRFFSCLEFWKIAGGQLNPEEVAAYMKGTRKDLPSGTTHLKYLGALRTLVMQTFPAVYHVNADMARGFDPKNHCEVMPYSDGEPKPNHQFGVQYEYILHHLLQYGAAVGHRGINEALFYRIYGEIEKIKNDAIPGFSQGRTWQQCLGAISAKADTLPRGADEEVNLYKAFIHEDCWRERLNFLRYLMFNSPNYMKIFREQVTCNSQDMTSADVRMASGTGDPYSLNLADPENDSSKDPDVITAETLLSLFTVSDGAQGTRALEGLNLPVLQFSTEDDPVRRQGLPSLEEHMAFLCAQPDCRAVINTAFEICQNKYEKLVGKLRMRQEGRERQFLYVDSKTRSRMMLDPGEDAVAVDYHPDQVNRAKGKAIAFYGPAQKRGIEFLLPKGKNDFGVVMVDLSTTLDELAQALWRMRQLGYGQQGFLSIDTKMRDRIYRVTGKERGSVITMGDVIKAVIRKTVDDDKLLHVKAATFAIKAHLKKEIEAVLRTPYELATIADPAALIEFEKIIFEAHRELYLQVESIDWMRLFKPQAQIERMEYIRNLCKAELRKLHMMQHKFQKLYGAKFAKKAVNQPSPAAPQPQPPAPQPATAASAGGWMGFLRGTAAAGPTKLHLGNTELSNAVEVQINKKLNALKKAYANVETRLKLELHNVEHDPKTREFLQKNLPEKIPGDVDGHANTDMVVEMQVEMEMETERQVEMEREQHIMHVNVVRGPFKALAVEDFLAGRSSETYRSLLTTTNGENPLLYGRDMSAQGSGLTQLLGKSHAYISARAEALVKATGAKGDPSLRMLVAFRKKEPIPELANPSIELVHPTHAWSLISKSKFYLTVDRESVEITAHKRMDPQDFTKITLIDGREFIIPGTFTNDRYMPRPYWYGAVTFPRQSEQPPELVSCLVTQTDITNSIGPHLAKLRGPLGNLTPVGVLSMTSGARQWYAPGQKGEPLFLESGNLAERSKIFNADYARLMLMNKMIIDWVHYTDEELALFIEWALPADSPFAAYAETIQSEKTKAKIKGFQDKLKSQRESLKSNQQLLDLGTLLDKFILDCTHYTAAEQARFEGIRGWSQPDFDKLKKYLEELKAEQTLARLEALRPKGSAVASESAGVAPVLFAGAALYMTTAGNASAGAAAAGRSDVRGMPSPMEVATEVQFASSHGGISYVNVGVLRYSVVLRRTQNDPDVLECEATSSGIVRKFRISAELSRQIEFAVAYDRLFGGVDSKYGGAAPAGGGTMGYGGAAAASLFATGAQATASGAVAAAAGASREEVSSIEFPSNLETGATYVTIRGARYPRFFASFQRSISELSENEDGTGQTVRISAAIANSTAYKNAWLYLDEERLYQWIGGAKTF